MLPNSAAGSPINRAAATTPRANSSNWTEP